MPRIPQFQANPQVQTPRLSPGAMAAPSEALARAGDNIQQLASDTNSAFAQAAKREQDIIRKIKAADIEAQVEDGYSKAAFGLRSLGVDEHELYNEKIISEITDSAMNLAKDDRELSAIVQPYLSRKKADYLNASRGSLYKKLGDKAEAHIERMNIQALDLYATAQTPEERAMIRNNLAVGIEGFVADGLVDPKVPVVLMENFDNLAESVRADRAIDDDPYSAKKLIESGEFNLDAKLTQDKIDNANREIKHKEVEDRVAANEAKQAEREARIDAERSEMRSVASAFMSGDLTKAQKLLNSSQFIDGGTAISLTSRITEASQKVNFDSTEISAEIVKANDMITKGEDPESIITFVATNPKLSKEDKEQYINKLETNLSSEIKSGRDAGYKDIYDLIVPKLGIGAKIIQTGLQTERVKIAQMQLDDWVDAQEKSGKRPTKNEVRAKAIQLGKDNQPSIVEQIEYQKKYGEKIKGELEMQYGDK